MIFFYVYTSDSPLYKKLSMSDLKMSKIDLSKVLGKKNIHKTNEKEI